MVSARKLSLLIIDDAADRYLHVIKVLERFADVVTITSLQDALEELQNFKRGDQIDIILCDMNMYDEKNTDRKESILPEINFGNNSYQAWFGIQNLEGLGGVFHPYGPIIALPFSKFFYHGGVIWPISSFWSDPRLVGSRYFNGYVFVVLSLIWGHADKSFVLPQFGSRFEPLYRSAEGLGSTDINIRQEFLNAVRERRRQLYTLAEKLPYIMTLSSTEALAKNSDIHILIRGEDELLREERFKTQSLYSDLVWQFDRLLPESERAEAVRRVDSILKEEIKLFGSKCFDEGGVFEFCACFIKRQSEESIDLASRYAKVYTELGVDNNPDIPTLSANGGKPPYHIQRYLLLFAQLQHAVRLRGKKFTRINEHMCELLGLEQHEHTLPDFLELNASRNPQRGKEWALWIRPFNDAGRPLEGWKGFNRLHPPRGAMTRFTDLDRTFSARFWKYLGQKTKLPLGLANGGG